VLRGKLKTPIRQESLHALHPESHGPICRLANSVFQSGKSLHCGLLALNRITRDCISLLLMLMTLEELKKEKLWLFLVDTVHSIVMYPGHKGYTRETLLRENPELTAMELSNRLHTSLGEALVILNELRAESKPSDQGC